MSSPFYGVRPLSIPFGGTTDAAGNFTALVQVRSSFWSLVKVIAENAAAPQATAWKAALDNSTVPLDYAAGPRCSMGPFIVPPTQNIKVTISGGAVSGNVIGQLIGKEMPNQEMAATHLLMASNPLTVTVPPLVLAALQLVGLQGVDSTQVFTTGSGAANIRTAGWPVGLDTFDNAILVSRRGTAPADWEIALSGAVINAAPAAANFTQIIAAPGVSTRLIIHWAEYQTSTSGVANNAFGNLADDSAAVILSRYSQNFTGVIEKIVKGPIKLPVNQGLRLTNEGAVAAIFMQGAVLYTTSTAG